VHLREELERMAATAAGYAAPGEELTGVICAEPHDGTRLYVCAFAAGDERSWLALDAGGAPVEDRALVRDAVSIAAMCELAEETAGGGRLDELRAELVSVRLTEGAPGIREAEAAALALERTIQSPRVASTAYLDAIGAAAHRLELALGTPGASPFATAMQQGVGVVGELVHEVEEGYKRELR
jgi:hypothetical protein